MIPELPLSNWIIPLVVNASAPFVECGYIASWRISQGRREGGACPEGSCKETYSPGAEALPASARSTKLLLLFAAISLHRGGGVVLWDLKRVKF